MEGLHIIRPYSEFFVAVTQFHIQDDPLLQLLSNQIRALVDYGSFNRQGFNFSGGIIYDLRNTAPQNQFMQATNNGNCTLSFECRHIALGQVRSAHQFRIAFTISNIGTFDNRRQERDWSPLNAGL